MTRYTAFHISGCLLFVNFLLSFIILAQVRNIDGLPIDLYLAEHKQLFDDWQAKPFVDITLVKAREGDDPSKELVCPEDYEPLISKTWPGTEEICIGGNKESKEKKRTSIAE